MATWYCNGKYYFITYNTIKLIKDSVSTPITHYQLSKPKSAVRRSPPPRSMTTMKNSSRERNKDGIGSDKEVITACKFLLNTEFILEDSTFSAVVIDQTKGAFYTKSSQAVICPSS